MKSVTRKYNFSAVETSGPAQSDSSTSDHYPRSQSTSINSDLQQKTDVSAPHTKTPHFTSVNYNTAAPSVIVVVAEGRGMAKGEIGMASIDLKCPELVLSQFPDSQTYIKTLSRLRILNPVEIIVPATACEPGKETKLLLEMKSQFPDCSILPVERRHFNEMTGLQLIRHLCVKEYGSVEMDVSAKYYCLAALAALIKHVEFIQNTVYAPKSLRIVFVGSGNSAMIDIYTVKSLELLQSMNRSMPTCNLFGVLNFCKTAGGIKLLRANILQPPCTRETILTRHDCVAELTESEELYHRLQTILSRFIIDIDHVLSLCVQTYQNHSSESVRAAEAQITNVIYLKHIVELVEPLREALSESMSPLLRAYYESLNDGRYKELLTKIMDVVNEDTAYQKSAIGFRLQKCFAVKPNLNGLLDVARRTYTENVDEVCSLISRLADEMHLPLRPCYNVSRGFHIQITQHPKKKDDFQLPPELIQRSKSRNTMSCTTEEIITLNSRVQTALSEIYVMSQVVVSELLYRIIEDVGCLHKLSEIVSNLDVLVSLAHAAIVYKYVRPKMDETFAVKRSKHPILNKVLGDATITNDIYASVDYNLLVITGPNMSGKTTYMKQIALIQIMAQIGSFVPAEYASLRIVDRIFSKMGNDDDMESNASTFTMEMRQLNYILDNCTDSSLILLDELGYGTNVEEGFSICWATCEHLLKLKAFTFVSTHFHKLTELEEIYSNVVNCHFRVDHVLANKDVTRIEYTHSLVGGPTTDVDYALMLAEVSTLPKDIVTEAKVIREQLRPPPLDQNEKLEAERRKGVTLCAFRLIQVARNASPNAEPGALTEFLMELKDDILQALQPMAP